MDPEHTREAFFEASEDGERRAAHGHQAVAKRFHELMSRLGRRLAQEPVDRLIPVWTVAAGATRLDTYLATRVVELLVHADDLAASVNLPPVAIPKSAAAVAIEVFVELARSRSGDLAVIRAFARRERADDGTLRVL